MPALELPPILVDELLELDAGEDNEGVILVNEEINLMTLFLYFCQHLNVISHDESTNEYKSNY